MENPVKKETKIAKPVTYSAIRVRKETRKRILTEVARINKKDFGRKVRPDEFIALAISLVTPEHILKLQESSLSNADRFERDYREFVEEHGHMTKDEYLGKRLSGEIIPGAATRSSHKASQNPL